MGFKVVATVWFYECKGSTFNVVATIWFNKCKGSTLKVVATVWFYECGASGGHSTGYLLGEENRGED